MNLKNVIKLLGEEASQPIRLFMHLI